MEETYFLIRHYPAISVPELDFLTGGWAPLTQFVEDVGIVILFTQREAADRFAKEYAKTSGSDARLEVGTIQASQLSRLSVISANINAVTFDATISDGVVRVESIQQLPS